MILPEIDPVRLQASLECGECLRCRHLFQKKKLFCPECHSPNFLALPRLSALVTVGPFLAIVGFFVLFARFDVFPPVAIVVAVAMLVLATFFALWTVRSASIVRRARENILIQVTSGSLQKKEPNQTLEPTRGFGP